MSALALPGVDTLPPVRLRQKALSQWHTPDDVALRLAGWAGSPPQGWRVLEPSAGGGALVKAALKSWRSPRIDAVELDPVWASPLRHVSPRVSVECCDYLARPAPTEPYDCAIMNPPYEGGLDGRFLAKAMAESMRVIALVRLATLAGQARHEQVWSLVDDDGPWRLVGLAIFAARPSFLAAGEDSDGGKTDFVAVKLSRVASEGVSRTAVEWWT